VSLTAKLSMSSSVTLSASLKAVYSSWKFSLFLWSHTSACSSSSSSSRRRRRRGRQQGRGEAGGSGRSRVREQGHTSAEAGQCGTQSGTGTTGADLKAYTKVPSSKQ
jgi:hypothetical protein